jgi:hypothetical protein
VPAALAACAAALLALSACGGGGSTAGSSSGSTGSSDGSGNAGGSGGTTASVPGAPRIGSATAGNGSATISFSAPASDGGSAITGYLASCAAGGSVVTGSGTASPVTVSGLANDTTYSCTVAATNGVGTGSPSAAVSVTPSAGSGGGDSGDSGGDGASGTASTAGVHCSDTTNVYNSSASVQATSTASWSCTGSERVLSANGIPDHDVGTFPNANNPSAIAAQTVNAAMTLTPADAGSIDTDVHVIGFAFNGVKFDPATAASCSVDSGGTTSCTAIGNTGSWSIEALGQTSFVLGLDSNNAHVQPDGSYHYHGMPEGYLAKLGNGEAMTLVGFAMDGFPIYARYGHATATDANSAIRIVTSSYQLKSTPDSGRPSTTDYPMGTFTQDYQYVAGSGDLDECNGRFGVTPEFPNGIYHYYITDTYPYIQRCLKGTALTP